MSHTCRILPTPIRSRPPTLQPLPTPEHSVPNDTHTHTPACSSSGSIPWSGTCCCGGTCCGTAEPSGDCGWGGHASAGANVVGDQGAQISPCSCQVQQLNADAGAALTPKQRGQVWLAARGGSGPRSTHSPSGRPPPCSRPCCTMPTDAARSNTPCSRAKEAGRRCVPVKQGRRGLQALPRGARPIAVACWCSDDFGAGRQAGQGCAAGESGSRPTPGAHRLLQLIEQQLLQAAHRRPGCARCCKGLLGWGCCASWPRSGRHGASWRVCRVRSLQGGRCRGGVTTPGRRSARAQRYALLRTCYRCRRAANWACRGQRHSLAGQPALAGMEPRHLRPEPGRVWASSHRLQRHTSS